jgi:hypothetical protein
MIAAEQAAANLNNETQWRSCNPCLRFDPELDEQLRMQFRAAMGGDADLRFQTKPKGPPLAAAFWA